MTDLSLLFKKCLRESERDTERIRRVTQSLFLVQTFHFNGDLGGGGNVDFTIWFGGAWWLSGRASDSGARGQGFETYLRHVVSLRKTFYSSKVLVIPRKQWLCPDMTEKLLTGMLNLNTNKQTKLFGMPKIALTQLFL